MASASTGTTQPPRPTSPKMGTVEETYAGSGEYYLCFGGVPKPDWTGIESRKEETISDLCYRSLDPLKGQKSVSIRSEGLTHKLAQEQNIREFQERVWEHLVKHGLDTMAYLPDPRDPTKVINVVEEHAKFIGDLEGSLKNCSDLRALYDTWDHKHDNEAKTFLINSIDPHLYKGFKPFYDKNSLSFTATWLKLVNYLLTTNSSTYDLIKSKIRNLRPQNFSGQNIEQMSAEYIKMFEELESGGYMDNGLLINVINGFLCADKDVKGTFHFEMNSLYKEAEAIQKKVVFMSKEDQNDAYVRAKMTYRDICLVAVRTYKSLKSHNFWEPSKLPKDRMNPYANYVTKDEIMNLIATGGSKPNTPLKSLGCFNCGDPDHIASECPKPKNPKFQQEFRTKMRHKNMAEWRLKAPQSGEPQTKVVNGRKYYWCAKCRNWSTTHSTEKHKGGKGGFKNNKKKRKESTNLASWEPSAWIVETNVPEERPLTVGGNEERNTFNIFEIVMYFYFVLTLPVLLATLIPTFTLSPILQWISMEGIKSQVLSIPTYIFQLLLTFKNDYMFLIAPLSWIICGILVSKIPSWFKETFNPTIDLHQVPRAERRREQRRRDRPTYRHKSARDHRLNSRYPLRLRNNNQFNSRASTPNIEDRELYRVLQEMQAEHDLGKARAQAEFRRRQNTRNHGRVRQRQPNEEGLRTSYHESRSDSPVQVSCLKVTKGQRKIKTVRNTDKKLSPQELVYKPEHVKSWPRGKKVGSQSEKHQYQSFNNNKHSRCKTKYQKNCPHSEINRLNLKISKLEKYGGKYSDTKQVVKKYKPVGVSTNRDLPNHNMTVGQFCRLQRRARVLLTDVNIDDSTKKIARKISTLSPSGFQAAMNDQQGTSYKVIWDSGASVCVTPDREDFIEYTRDSDIPHVKGIGGIESEVMGQGTVSWCVHDNNGSLRTLNLPAYHIPTCKSRLISTSALLKAYKGEFITVDAAKLQLSGKKGNKHRNSVNVFNHPSTRLPTSSVYRAKDIDKPAATLCYAVSTVNESNFNLSEAQKELLRWHQKLGHLEFKKIQHLMRTGILSHTAGTRALHTAASKLIEPPKCAACMFGKQTVRSSPGHTRSLVRDRAGVLRAGNLLPGNEVSVDHFVSSVKGRLFKGFNRGSIENKFIGGCIFVDHASQYTHVELQSTLSSHETLRAKLAYERHCRDYGVMPQTYMSDNGKAFTSRDFVDHLSKFYQISKFAGVGAHHHNAIAERAIRTIMSIARTMMIHSGIHWPDVSDPGLWPMAVKHACFLFNHVPHYTTGLSPTDIFTKTRWPQRKFMDLHVWGCPVYVLEKSLQDGKKIPKWRPRSRRSIYMGLSDLHASSVPLVLNTDTGAITPQFHVVFDDWFATVTGTIKDLPNFSSKEWTKLFGESVYQYITDETQEEEIVNHDDLRATMESNMKSDIISYNRDKLFPSTPLDVEQPPEEVKKDSDEVIKQKSMDTPVITEKEQVVEEPKQEQEVSKETPKLEEEKTETPEKPKSQPKPQISERKLRSDNKRPSRTRKEVKRFTYDSLGTGYKDDGSSYLLEIEDIDETCKYYVMVATGKEANPDLLSYDEAMSSKEKLEWIAAATTEVRMLEKLDCWEEIPIEEATEKVLPGTWVFKIKRCPDGTFKKFKARYCIRGDLQEGVFDTYAPVVHFSSVRLFLAWSLMFGWFTFSIDFSSAFIQAKLVDPAFIHLPRGFKSQRKGRTCLRLKRSIYGLSTAPRLWFQHLWKALKGLGFKQSEHDACLLFRKDMIIICYVDDLGIQAPKKELVDTLIDQLRKQGFSLTLEGSFLEYLGIQYKWNKDNTLEMSQQG